MHQEQIADLLAREFRTSDFLWVDDAGGDPYLVIPRQRLLRVAGFLKGHQELRFDTLMCLSGVHLQSEPEMLQVVYHLHSMVKRHRFVLKVNLDRAALPHYYMRLPSVSGLWTAALWMEREVFDMFGIHFTGNRDFRRLLLPHDWQGHPLLKDYVEMVDVWGISTARDGPDWVHPAGR